MINERHNSGLALVNRSLIFYNLAAMKSESQVLEAFPLLQKPELVREILENATIMVAKAGDVIVREGQYLKVLPLMLNGSLRVTQQSDGREILLYFVQPGETCIMSLTSCFFNVKSPSTAVAETDSEILCIPTRFVKEWQRKHDAWNEFVLRTFQSRYNELLDLFNAVVFSSIENRIASYLKNYAAMQHTSTVPITHQALANALGTTRVVTSRILKRFEQEGKIDLHHRNIRIIKL